ncbi:predicted protein [Coccidioides posadasii str. Silveira]|uniref:Predicted protein n=2 Tax=Coccidioides posadasii TaxID=199306 RepID=E9DA32_COCPS|nr:predicted protein [Coccidioides posadasii str. Silveira]KMM64475.1 hypothetical protein CPAG_00827 [Coccidioides posadasii RMSCC 3488]
MPVLGFVLNIPHVSPLSHDHQGNIHVWTHILCIRLEKPARLTADSSSTWHLCRTCNNAHVGGILRPAVLRASCFVRLWNGMVTPVSGRKPTVSHVNTSSS